jgi:hypothetical protein
VIQIEAEHMQNDLIVKERRSSYIRGKAVHSRLNGFVKSCCIISPSESLFKDWGKKKVVGLSPASYACY